MDKYLERSLASKCKGNITIFDAFTKADSVINNSKYDKIVCSISGGSDSDVMLDIIHKVDIDNKVRYVWFDTGLEYRATKDHLDYLESRYGIRIERVRAIKPIPLCCKQHGQPFLNKDVSDKLYILQNNNFQFEDLPYEVLIQKYPKCKSTLKWWCNKKGADLNSDQHTIMYNIGHEKWLKEFLISNPPKFKISRRCCDFSKKLVSKKYIAEVNADLVITGVRKAEGGVRQTVYKNCYTITDKGTDYYRPIFWFLDNDKYTYKQLFKLKYSDCYEKWGFARTGCVGCPYNSKFATQLNISGQYEPNLVTACNNIFRDSYAYTKQFKEFYRLMEDKQRGLSRLF